MSGHAPSQAVLAAEEKRSITMEEPGSLQRAELPHAVLSGNKVHLPKVTDLKAIQAPIVPEVQGYDQRHTL